MIQNDDVGLILFGACLRFRGQLHHVHRDCCELTCVDGQGAAGQKCGVNGFECLEAETG